MSKFRQIWSHLSSLNFNYRNARELRWLIHRARARMMRRKKKRKVICEVRSPSFYFYFLLKLISFSKLFVASVLKLTMETLRPSRPPFRGHFEVEAHFTWQMHAIDYLENTHLLCKGKYHCTADLLFDWFGFNQTCESVSNSSYAKQLYPN